MNLTAHTMYNILFSVDLDSVYKTSAGDKVYWLDKVEVDKRNIWQLIISVELIDGTMKEVNSRGFRIRTKPRESQSSGNCVLILVKQQKNTTHFTSQSDLYKSGLALLLESSWIFKLFSRVLENSLKIPGISAKTP